jgi:hypothetical protein
VSFIDSGEEESVDAPVRSDNALGAEKHLAPEAMSSRVSWASIGAGGAAAAALSLTLLALGAGLGLSSISPWADSGVSASTFSNGAGAYLVIVAVMSSAVGGYLAARLRTRWAGLHNNEVFFRDTAHGFITWASRPCSARRPHAATTHIVAGAASGCSGTAGSVAQNANPHRFMWTACGTTAQRRTLFRTKF